MIFSETEFLFRFLPAVLLAALILRKFQRNAILLVASLFFYAWGEKQFVAVMVGSIVGNYGIGRWLDSRETRSARRLAAAVGIAANLALLIVFKYLGFIVANLGFAFAALGFEQPVVDVRLPIGISFFTFQAMSFVIDLYRGDAPMRRNPVDFGLYIALFPQLIAGPIVRYGQIAEQLVSRAIDLDGFAHGARRFVVGLGKKILIADTVAECSDAVFLIPTDELSAGVAWAGAICYTAQIYFDFSGYSDMAIGLGKMLGFSFPENFLHPYTARSVTDFWRRWHVSLSSWFRDYLYIPMGGNRGGSVRTAFNLVVVFLLCGLWHGANWTFVAWGAYHGAFLVIERVGLARVVARMPRALQHVYLMLTVIAGWVLFRSSSITQATAWLGAMLGIGEGDAGLHPVALYFDTATALALAAAVIGSTSWAPSLVARLARARRVTAEFAGWACDFALATVFVLAAIEISGGTASPFIYFRF